MNERKVYRTSTGIPVAREMTAAMSLSVTSAPNIDIWSDPDDREASLFSNDGMTELICVEKKKNIS